MAIKNIAKTASRQLGGRHLLSGEYSARLKCRSQATGQVTGYRPQATGHRLQVRQQATGQVTGHTKNNTTLDKTVLD